MFFELEYLFINKKSFGDTKSTLSVVLLKAVSITLPFASEKDYIWKI